MAGAATARARPTWMLALPIMVSLMMPVAHSSGVTTPAAGQSTLGPAATVTVKQSTALTLTRVDPVVAAPGEPLTVAGLLDPQAIPLDEAGDPEPATGIPTVTPTTTPTATTGAEGTEGTGTGGTDTEDAAAAIAPIAAVEVRVGGERIESPADIDAWLAGIDASQGELVASVDIPASASAASTAPEIPAADGDLAWSVTIPDLRERMRDAYGVLPVSVEVWPTGATEPVAVTRTFVGYQVRKEYVPLQLTWVVPLTVPYDPTLVGVSSAERTEAWQALVGADGTLRARLEAADAAVVWAVDPELLTGGPLQVGSEPGDLDGADEVGTPSATPSTGPAPEGGETDDTLSEESDAEAERRIRLEFAAELLSAARGRDILLLPRHDADVAALPAPGSTEAAEDVVSPLIGRSLDVDAATLSLSAAGARVTPAAWPADGSWSSVHDAALHELSGLSASGQRWSVLASTASLTGAANGPFPAASGATVLPYDEAMSARANRAHDVRTSLTTGLTLVAETLVRLNERPGTARRVTIALDRSSPAADVGAELAEVLEGVPWLEPTTALTPTHTGLLAREAPATAVPVILDDIRARALASTMSRLPTAASVRADGDDDLATRGADTLAQLTSERWRGHSPQWNQAYDPIAVDVAETFTGLHIPPRDISFLADSGLLRVTIENTLDTGIENATLDLVVAEPILRIESEPQTVEVGAQSRGTVGFQATALASGRVTVTATLRAPDGSVLGEPTEFSVRVSPTSDWIYWVLGGAATIVIVIGLVRMATRRRPASQRPAA